MRRLFSSLCLCLPLACASTSEEPTGDDTRPGAGGKADDPIPGVTDAEFGLDERPANPTCFAQPRPVTDAPVRTSRVFASLSFTQPVAMLHAPGDDSEWYVVEKPGTVRVFDNRDDASEVRTFVDIRNIVDSEPNEAGLLGMAFHPQFESNGRVFLSFNLRQGQQLWSVLTQIRSTDGGQTLDPTTHEILFSVRQPFDNHNGGHISFGPDGFLYLGLGDGGSANDPNGNGQNTSTHLGSLLRFDVDNPSNNQPYGIPADNPFAGGGGQPEIYAFGLRNPWRFSWDSETGDLWLADVGQDEFEEIDLIERGGNYGWNLKEGFECFAASRPCDDLGVIDPVATYDHSQGDRSITGGYMYRGSDIPGLVGAYVYGDIVTGRIWGLFPSQEGWESRLLLESSINMATFAEGADGEIYIPNFFDGSIHQLRAAGAQPTDNFPKRLSQTGCVDPNDPRVVVDGAIPYDVASPLWSDGADKERYAAIPDGARIEMEPDGDFVFPIGTVLIKTFKLRGKRVETRLMMRHDDGGWGGYTYKWSPDQTDAELLPSSEVVEVDGVSWRIPSRADCTACHTVAAGNTLGPEFLQFNGDFVYASTARRANQLQTWAHIGMFSNLDSQSLDTDNAPRLAALDDDSASIEDRARSYLHSNCSSCHRPGGPGRSEADMRFLVNFAEQRLCNERADNDLGLNDPRLVKPGDPENSALLHRMGSLDASRMPALGSDVVDEEAVGLLSEWIADLGGCP